MKPSKKREASWKDVFMFLGAAIIGGSAGAYIAVTYGDSFNQFITYLANLIGG